MINSVGLTIWTVSNASIMIGHNIIWSVVLRIRNLKG